MSISPAAAGAPAVRAAGLPAITRDDGHPLSRAAFTGKLTVVNFWATWCAACRAELPSLDRLASKQPGLQIIAASVDDDHDAAKRYFGTRYPHLKLAFASLGDVQRYGALGLPYSVLLGRNGSEAARVGRALRWDGPEGARILNQAL